MRLDHIAGRGGTDNVRYGSLADILISPRQVRFTPDSGRDRRLSSRDGPILGPIE
jgi:hypothetical protein